LVFHLDDSAFRHIFQHQITDLILHNNDEYPNKRLLETYTTNVYSHVMVLFQNLKHLAIVESSVNEYPPLLLRSLPSATYFSSTLTVLRISVLRFEDCLSLLDGRLKQLTTFAVQIDYICSPSLYICRNMVS
jgi:hypothetical protein